MHCPSCQLAIKEHSKFCNHCGYKLSSHDGNVEVVHHNDNNDADAIVQQTTSEKAELPTTENVQQFTSEEVELPTIENVKQSTSEEAELPKEATTEDKQHKKTSDYSSLVFSVIMGVISASLVWATSVLLALFKGHALMHNLWQLVALNLLQLPPAKVVLLEQQFGNPLWFIANVFAGGHIHGTYTIGTSLFTSFEGRFSLLSFALVFLLLAFLSEKVMAFVARKKQWKIGLVGRLGSMISYSVVTWLGIAIPLLLFSPTYELPFIEASEKLELQLSLLPSFLYSFLLLMLGLVLAKAMHRKLRIMLFALSLPILLFVRDIVLNFKAIAASHFSLSAITDAGFDALYLNRLFIQAISLFFPSVATESITLEALHLPDALTPSSSTLISWLMLLVTLLIIARLSWKELIQLVALFIAAFLLFFYCTTIDFKQPSTLELNLAASSLANSLSYRINLVAGLALPLLAAIGLIIVLKLLYIKLEKRQAVTGSLRIVKHVWRYSLSYGGAALSLVLLFSTLLMLNEQQQAKKINDMRYEAPFEHEWAKQLYIMQHGPEEYGLIHAQKLWNKQGTPESKALLAISYLQAYQLDRAHVLLKESLVTKNKLFTKEELEALLELTDSSNPLSMINQATLLASTEQIDIDNHWHETMDTQVVPQIKATLIKAEQERLSSRLKQELQLIQHEIKLDPAYIDFVKVLDNESMDSLLEAYKLAINEINDDIYTTKQAIAESGVMIEASTSPEETTASHTEQEQWDAFLHNREHYILALAKAAIYFRDIPMAEQLLSILVTAYPTHEEAVLLLSSLYLNDVQPTASLILNSSLYDNAVHTVSKTAAEKLAEVLKDYTITSEAALQETVENSFITEDIGSELAYTILEPLVNQAKPQVDYQLAKYYFHTNQEDLATTQIERLNTRVDELTSEQQQLIHQLQSLPPKAKDMTIEEMQLKHDLTKQLYTEMEPMKGKSYYDQEPASKEQAFSVFLSHTLLSFNKSAIQVTSVQYDEGEVTLYLQSDNVELVNHKLSITDNGQKISNYELTKLSETSSFARYLMLILDRSGSMDGNKIEVAKQSAIEFIQALQFGEQVGVITFSDSSAVVQSFTSSLSDTAAALNQITADGGTRIAPALNLSTSQLQFKKGERIAFILSDGEDSEFSDPQIRQAIIHEANRAGITIYAVGFDAGYETLRDVAEGTGGYYIGASDFETLSQSFDKISETLSQTYQLKYQVDPQDYGLHTVKLTQQTFVDEEHYLIQDPNGSYSMESELGSQVDLIDDSKFSVRSLQPNKILISNTGSTEVTVEGSQLKTVTTVSVNGKEVSFKAKSNSKLTFTVSNKQTKGKANVLFTTEDDQQKSLILTFTDAKAQQSMPFGYATLYGDSIDTRNGEVEISGNPSIDQFIYPHSNTMQLSEDEVLSFTGIDLYTNKASQRVYDAKMEMSIADFGKNFDLESQGLYNKLMNDLPGLDRFGISIRLAKAFAYEANMKNDDGTLNISGGITGFDKLNQLNQSLKFKVNTRNGLLEFLPTNATLAQAYTKEGYSINADFGLNIALPMLAFDSVSAGFKYESPDKRVVLRGQVSGFELFNMPTSGNSLGSVALDVGIHFANGLDRLGAELESNKPVPLGPTGLGVNKLGLVADWSKKNEGSLTLGLTTMSDAALNTLINGINSIPVVNKIFNIDPSICLICLTGTLGFNELGSKDWALHGKVTAEVLGLQIQETGAKATRHELEFTSNQNVIIYTLDQTASIVFKDTMFNNYTTLKLMTEIDAVGFNPHTLAVVMVPQRVKASYIELSKEKKGKTITIQRIGNSLNMIKS